MVGLFEHSFPPEAVKKGLEAYHAILDKHSKADAWMSNPEIPDEKKLAEFFRYYAEIVCARSAYERLFRGIGIEYEVKS